MRTNICLAFMALFALAPIAGVNAQYSLTVEASAPADPTTPGTVYRFYVNANDATDKMSAVFGNDQANLIISTPEGIFNSSFNSGWNAAGINPLFLTSFPSLADDSYATIGLTGPASTTGPAGSADPSLVEDSSLSPTISEYFVAGGTALNVTTLTGGSWYVLNTATNALPVDGRWLIAQITTTGALSGQMNYQIFPLGVGADQVQLSTPFDGIGTFGGDSGTVEGCTDDTACNYDATADSDDGSCVYPASDDVDCDGNCLVAVDCAGECGGSAVLDAVGDCGGSCTADEDGDGICDDVDPCVGELDACGECNGDNSSCTDCAGVVNGSSVADACGVCNGDGTTCTGCADPLASNYDVNNIVADNGQCVYATTFNVDMSCFDNAGASVGGFDSFYEVFVTGPIFGWAANDGYNQLTDVDGDGIYSVTLDFPAGDVEYKYAIDGFADQEQLVDDMQNEGGCAPITDFAGYANRQVAAGSTTNDTYGSCTSCEDQVVVEMFDLTLQVDMTQYAEAYAYGGVFVNGSFNGWCGDCNAMSDDDADGIWTVTLSLAAGTYEYKFTLDGWNYQEEFAGGESCTSTIDGFTNRTLTLEANTTLPAVCWETCDACPSIDDVLGCMDESANNYNADATLEPENSCLYDLTVSVDISQTSFTGVTLAGGFNGWNNGSNPMSDDDGDGVYSITVSVTAGAQEYKFLANGDWGLAESFDGTESCTTDPAEFVNRVILVEGPTTVDTVCYNSCEACVDGEIFGCTDSAANNFNVDATADDASCLYNTTFNVDMSCAGADFYEVFVTGPLWGWPANNGFNQLLDADGDGVYSVTIETPAGDVEYKYGIDGFADQENLIDDMQNGASCAPVTDYNGYANRLAASGSTTNDTYGSCEACPDEVEGCIDETACNYDPAANVQAFVSVGSGQLSIELTAGSWPSEISWTLNGATYGAPYSGTLDLEPGMYLIEGFDSYGDGWNGASMSITDLGSGSTYALEVSGSSASVEVEVTGAMASTCDFESCAGCTDETACNYDETATLDDGTCEDADDLTGCGDTCLDGGVLYEFSITDAFGDGMCCAYGEGSYTLLVNGEELATGGDFGDGAIERFCAPADACVQLVMVADNYPSEQSWSLSADGTELASGNGASETYNFGTCVEGCTDEAACNYSMDANADDGSCFFAPDYYDCDGETCLNDTDGDGVCDELEIAGCVVPTACNYVASGVTDLVPCVYPDAGYNCDGTCIGDADQDGVCDANEIVGCQDNSACNYNADATDAGDCDFTSCLGCTDEMACNYDSSATQNDGSCDFCSCASDANGGQNGFNLAVETYAENGVQGTTTYRVYVTTPNATDFVSAIAGDEINPSYLRTSTSFFQSGLGGLTADMINPLFFSAFPELAYDSWLTIGIESAPVPGDGTSAVTLAQAAGDTWAADFEAGQNLELNSFFGGSWFTTNLSTNGVAGDDQKVLIAQLTTDGTLTGQLYIQVFPEGVGANAEYLTLSFGSSTCGCTDENACNYNAGAIYDDGSCVIAGIYTCEGVCANDADGDGVCDELEIVGCYDEEACNYNADATDEGTCEYVQPTLLPESGAGCTLFFSGYAEGSSNNKFMEIYNPTDATIDLTQYGFPNVSNAPDNGEGNYDFWNDFPAGASIAPGDVYVIAHGSSDPSILAEADHLFTFLSNGDDGFMLVFGTSDNYVAIDAIGDFNGDPGSGWDVAGVSAGTKDHSLIRKSDITNGNGGDWIGSAGTDADNSEWIVLDNNDWTGLGSHDFSGSCGGGTYAVVYDCDGVCLSDTDGDGVCDELEIAGCTDSGACNYEFAATDDNGSCEYLTCAGCTDLEGCNYDDAATIEDGSCTYPDPFLDCAGNCLNDLNINGICDELEVLGCTYAAACNYDADANVDDGQCDFACLLTGCTDPAADNYDAAATVDNGNCFYVGCMDTDALNYDAGANFPGSCEYCEGDFNFDGEVDVNDLLDFFQLWGNVCE